MSPKGSKNSLRSSQIIKMFGASLISNTTLAGTDQQNSFLRNTHSGFQSPSTISDLKIKDKMQSQMKSIMEQNNVEYEETSNTSFSHIEKSSPRGKTTKKPENKNLFQSLFKGNGML